MKILVLSNVPPGAVGGAEVQALRLARSWAANGHIVTIAGYANSAVSEDHLTIIRIKTIRRWRVLRAVTYATSTFRLLWSERREFDVIYCRFLKEQAFVACVARAFIGFRQPIIACPAGSDKSGDAAYVENSPFKFVWKKVLDIHLSCINVMTPRIEAEVRRLGISRPRISRIPNGVPIPAKLAKMNRSSSWLSVVYVGRLVHVKGVDVLLDACASLKDCQIDFRLEIIGEGPLRRSLEEQSNSYGLQDRVSFAGRLPPETISARFLQADLFVLPSRSEGFPGSLLESFAHGVPAIATRVSGSESIVDEETGWIVPPEDPAALAGALADASRLGRQGLCALGMRARSKVQREYEIEAVAHRYVELFNELLNA